MSLRAILSSFVVLTLFMGCIASVEATTIVFDDFNDDTAALTGNVANSGQTWTDTYPTWVNGPMDTGAAYGQGGTVGAGYITADSRGNDLQIGPNIFTRQALLDLGGGTYTIGVDMNKGWSQEMGLELLDGGGGAVTLMWAGNQLSLGGSNDIWNIGGIQPATGSGYGGQIHVDLTIEVNAELENSTATLSYYGIADPDGVLYNDGNRPSGSIVGNTDARNFAYDGITIWGYRSGAAPDPGQICAGFDNISITQTVVPEPGMSVMLVIGLAALAFRRLHR